MRIALTRAVVVAGLLAAIGGCTPEQDCSSGCTVAALATFNLSCNPNDLTGVVASGPCSIPDAGLAWYTGVGSEQSVGVSSKGPGVCHVELTFATGFTYSADVTFTAQNDNCGGGGGGPTSCPTYYQPTQEQFAVNNPSNTCSAHPDAGAD